MAEKGQSYNTGYDTSSIGPQLTNHYYHKKAIVETAKERKFGQLADVMTMPKYHGKTIKAFRYIPLLDDRNVNDQGIDATGKSTTSYDASITLIDTTNNYVLTITANGVDATAANTALATKVVAWATANGITGATQAAVITALEAAGVTVINTGNPVPASGNLYGSSKDIGTITKAMPVLSEHGGRVNRVGNTRVEIKGTIHNYGFFEEFTKDSFDFDTDADLDMHITRESIRAASEITEDLIQVDLINSAAVELFGGDALKVDSLDATCTLSYSLIVKAEQVLNTNRCPKNTTMITGSRMTDTKTISAARYAYVGSELKHTLLSMKDFHNDPAWIPVQKYGAATSVASGEIGSIGGFRFIEAEEMTKWTGVGADASTEDTFYSTDDKFDVFPVLIVGSGSFTTIGFNSNKGSKFQIIRQKPGVATATYSHDPYGKVGFFSIQWWYGFMALRPEWIACIKVTAPMVI